MKFQKLEALEKHFKEAFPAHLSSIYVVICPSESERKKILSSLTQMLEKECDLKKCPLLKDAISHLSGSSLFSKKVAAVFDGVDLLEKVEQELLAKYIQSPNLSGHLILGSTNAKSLTEFYKAGKKEMVVLDLSKEKPWEEKTRLQKWIVQTMGHKKKKITPTAVESLLQRLPSDRFLLQQELDKLVCYIGDRMEIDRADVETICGASEEMHFFQLARDLIWNGPQNPPTLTDLSFILPLVGQLRYQLEMGLKMAALLKKGIAASTIASAFPKLWPKALEQVMQGGQKRGESYFRKGLLALYELELGLKTNLARPEVLFTRYCLELSYGA